MKLVYIHIPKTAGSSISKVLQGAGQGVWFRHGELEASDPQQIWDLDYLSGHFTRKALNNWIKRHRLSMKDVKVMTVIRHPFEQLQSNLGFPFELAARGEEIEEPWMKEMLALDPNSPADLCSVLENNPWILNLQWQYLVSGSYLQKALEEIDRIVIFPKVSEAVDYASQVLGGPPVSASVHENASRQKYVPAAVFGQSPLRERILEHHALDTQLFSEIVSRRLGESGLEAVSHLFPMAPEALLESWLSWHRKSAA